MILCRPKSLPLVRLAAAERRALEINPANAGERRSVMRTPVGRRGGPRRIAVLVARKWPATGVRLSVSFLDNPPSALRKRILEHMNAWSKSANVRFSETRGTGEVRIGRLDSPADMAGYWSYIGTEILDAPEDEPTLNLEGFTSRTSDAEFRRVVRHEAGHTLGFEHEHMRKELVQRIDRKKAIAYFDRIEGWTVEEVEQQVLIPLSERSLMGTTESDPLSIMCYHLPAAIMKGKSRRAITGGSDINAKDLAFAGSLYPKPTRAPERSVEAPFEAPAEPRPSVTRPASESTDTFQLIVMDELRPDTKPDENPKFAQVLATYGGARVRTSLRLRADKGEEPTRFGRIIGVHERIKQYTSRQLGALPTDERLLTFGEDLFETLFEGDVRRLYDEARARQRSRRLDVVLTSTVAWIAEKPWEFARDPGRKSFLATEDIVFIRNVLTNVPADVVPSSQGPLRILVAAAQPVGFERLSVDQEVAVIRRGFEPLIEAGLASVDVLARATPPQIHGHLSTKNYHIVHFIGHGVYDEERQEGCLIFETEPGREYPIGEREARELFCGRGLSLVFLNACETGRGGRAEFNKGIAQALVAHGLPAVVANQYSVLDSSATTFAQHFYWSLAQGLELGQSAREARIAVNYSLGGEPIDWAVPVVYARDPAATLCEPPALRAHVPTTTVRSAERRNVAAHEVRLGVWDMDEVFPSLERTLSVMSAAQSVYGFELIDISVPLDVWDHEEAEARTYLSAERLAGRLRRRPAELGIDVALCITRHWLRDDETLNLYAWWPEGKKPSIVVFSVAGFDELKPEGRQTDRVIANATVAAIAGFFTDVDTHARGPKHCPLFSNEAREFAHVSGEQKFDDRCRKLLKGKLGDRLPALDSLLDLFGEERNSK